MEENKVLKLTTLNKLKEYSKGAIVQLADFADGQPLVARVNRPSLLSLAGKGMIPNSLLGRATELFTTDGALNFNDESSLPELYSVLHIVAEASLVEPTVEDIEEAGLTLTDEQYMDIFNYSQGGVNALKSFRNEQKH